MKARHSISRVYKVIAFILIPTIIISVIASFYIRKQMSERVVSIFDNRSSHELAEQDRRMGAIHGLLLTLLNNNEAIQTITDGSEPSDSQIRTTSQLFSDLCSYYDERYHFFVWNRDQDIFVSPDIPVSANAPEDQMISGLQQASLSGTAEGISRSDWSYFQVSADQAVIVNVVYKNQTYLGSYITSGDFYDYFMANRTEDTQEYLFLVKDEDFLDASQTKLYEKITHHADMVVPKSGDTYRNLRYQLFRKNFSEASFDGIFAVNVLGEYGWAQISIYGALFLSLLFLLLGVWLLSYIRKRLVKPLNHFIENFAPQDPSDEGEPVFFNEIEQAQDMFEKAGKQIEALKIEVYEKELEQQEMELSFLQSQVHPHFYLNNMSIFYAMAQAGHYKEIQQLSMEIAEYFRFLLRDGTKLVKLSLEMEHVRRYLNIYQIRYENELDYQVNCEPGCEEAMVPPLMLFTLVENSFKYARQAEQVLTIRLKIEKITEKNGEFLLMTVTDNGPGFPEEVLEDLKNGVYVEGHDGYGIGLSNTIKRIRYFYKGKGSITFRNGTDGMAIVRVTIPFETSGDS